MPTDPIIAFTKQLHETLDHLASCAIRLDTLGKVYKARGYDQETTAIVDGDIEPHTGLTAAHVSEMVAFGTDFIKFLNGNTVTPKDHFTTLHKVQKNY